MKPKLGTLVLCAALGLGATAQGADYSDPSWPCIQRKVESLSLGLMWPYPVEDTERAADVQADIDELASRFALRRLELDEIEPALAAFTAKHGRSPDILGAVYVDAFDRLSATRKVIMKGISDYSFSQISLAEKIDAARTEMNKLMAAEKPDFDKVDELEAQADWDERIYTDRAKSLTYVCETPVLLEKRIYAIAQMLLATAEE